MDGSVAETCHLAGQPSMVSMEPMAAVFGRLLSGRSLVLYLLCACHGILNSSRAVVDLFLRGRSEVFDHGTHLCIVRNPWAVVLYLSCVAPALAFLTVAVQLSTCF